jgi:hypothetical protein
MDFRERLQKAVARGQQTGDRLAQERAQKALSEEELHRLHSKYQLELSEHIETCVGELATHFPGFKLESVIGDKGWGSAIQRDDLNFEGGKRNNLFSRFEIAVRPFSPAHVLEVSAKGTVHNKEIYNRSQFQPLERVDLASFMNMIDQWVLEYAELYAAKS